MFDVEMRASRASNSRTSLSPSRGVQFLGGGGETAEPRSVFERTQVTHWREWRRLWHSENEMETGLKQHFTKGMRRQYVPEPKTIASLPGYMEV